ncbi:Bug family tripartite tricarboxylate transporter substrate binding protein [Alicycliphilus denitrificans]|uniref:Tripartite tricarboxylate transporter substrate binding protein n=1 Tax=Alicycliphilus denitrificans TaxID=179636 RepID=A0A420KGL9_9BURK|nr:tripartite tricarboxylate transporter substrate binding protein [Alicycliphilus denitrificans]RKJ99093.1 tripartite tricarboxylate transporter substrate binding protein [Alicycliphilus denitrificans]
MIHRRLLLTLGMLAGVAGLGTAHAQATADYPNRPVKIIVPFPAGGTSDLMGRLIADELGKQLKQAFVVDNKGGAGGAIGTDAAAKAPADGYTLLLSGIGSNAVIHGFASPKPGYTESDFIHISQLAAGPNVLVVNPSFPAKTFKEFIAWVKANPGKFSYGQVTASSGHLTTEYLKQTAGLDMVGIPYKGGAPALNDVLANQIPGMFTNQDAVLPHVKAGKLRALVVTSAERNPLYPDVPTVAESGYPGFSAVSWTGLSAPKGTPKAIIEKLESAMVKAFAEPAARAKLEGNGFVVVASRSSDYTRFVNSEVDRWTKVIQTAGLKSE